MSLQHHSTLSINMDVMLTRLIANLMAVEYKLVRGTHTQRMVLKMGKIIRV